ncbi:hypothetical protein DPMN_118388 [Dreissena polymorpha]|uniref:Uncharacterized protein n=2 Tax=Dreissena polymorpha TaxID=45954 RepID=A0A9D4GGP0_DREPO|nr:hypothetical protein DPMN_118388 [Dreissena polymorpha]
MSQINRELREQLLSKTKKRRYRVAMLNASQQKLREGIESTLHLKEHTKTLLHETK